MLPTAALPQNCCAPSIPQQGIVGEMSALPKTIDFGLHYEYLRSEGMYRGSNEIDDPGNTKTVWNRATMTLGYGIIPGLSVSAILPYVWKEKTRHISDLAFDLENTSEGIGDLTFVIRYSPIKRSFVSFRELTFGAGVKAPTGSVEKRNFGFLLPEELQPGTGSWDYHVSASLFQGFEMVDLVGSGTFVITTPHNGYEFGDQFSYLLASNFHIKPWLDGSLALSGTVRGKDKSGGMDVTDTGRSQLWLVPGLKFQLLPGYVSLQAYYEAPIYQHFKCTQLASDYNLRLSTVCTIPLSGNDEE